MSDPMTNIGADDVLASIRRLLSGTQESQVHKTPSSAAPERFVLSPDLRVVDGNAELSLSSAQDHGIDQDPEQSSSQDDRSSATESQADLPPLILEQTSATHFPREVETPSLAETRVDDAARPTVAQDPHLTDDPAPMEAAATASSTKPHVDAAVHAAQALLQGGAQVTEWTPTFDDTPDAKAANHAAGLSLEERIAELESAVDSQSDDWDSDGSDDFDNEPPKVFPHPFAEPSARVLSFRSAHVGPFAGAAFDTDSVDFSEHLAFADETDADESVSGDALANDALATHAADVALDDTGTDTATDNGAAEVVDVAQDPVDTPVSKPADVSQASQPRDQATAPTEAAPTEAATAVESDDDFALAGYSADELFDEGALRDMIAEVIREELQGDLGARITSNVRRLVRREVQRALTLREFE